MGRGQGKRDEGKEDIVDARRPTPNGRRKLKNPANQMSSILDEVKSKLTETIVEGFQIREYIMWYEEDVVPNTPVNSNIKAALTEKYGGPFLHVNGMLLPMSISARGMPDLVLKLDDLLTMQGWSYIEHEIAATYDEGGVQGVVDALCVFLGDMESFATIGTTRDGVEQECSMRFGVEIEHEDD
jgi:hypothetical protein